MGFSGQLLPWLGAAAAILLGIGLYLVWFVAPADYQQGETVKIMYLHVPAAWLGMSDIYGDVGKSAVFAEATLSILWAYCFVLLTAFWVVSYTMGVPPVGASPIPNWFSMNIVGFSVLPMSW